MRGQALAAQLERGARIHLERAQIDINGGTVQDYPGADW